MTPTDLIGFSGVLLILIAFFLNLSDRLPTSSLLYILLNLVGAGLACLASILMEYLPFILLEGVWTLVSYRALRKYLQRARRDREEQFV